MNLHRLLKRQIKDCFGDTDSIPEGLEKFIESVDVAYKDFDKDFDHAEHILKLSSQELYKVNNELKTINAKNTFKNVTQRNFLDFLKLVKEGIQALRPIHFKGF